MKRDAGADGESSERKKHCPSTSSDDAERAVARALDELSQAGVGHVQETVRAHELRVTEPYDIDFIKSLALAAPDATANGGSTEHSIAVGITPAMGPAAELDEAAIIKLKKNIEPVPRSYEEDFLREPLHSHERPCAHGEMCEGMFVDPNCGVVLREFILPSMAAAAKQHEDSQSSAARLPCLMCLRKQIAQIYFEFKGSTAPVKPDAIIQNYFNMCNVENEYCVGDTITSAQRYSGIIEPIVLHTRTAYEATQINGVRGYKQLYAVWSARGQTMKTEQYAMFFCRGANLKRGSRQT
jgi:hypothetical protein